MSDNSAIVRLQLANQTAPGLSQAIGDVRALTAEEAKLQTAQNRAAQSALQVATAAQRQATATQQTVAAAARAEQAVLRLSQAQEKAAKGGGSLVDSLRGIQGILAGAGFAIGVQQVIQFGAGATQAALALRETKNSLRAVAGDTAIYNQVLAAAREQQVLFGGTLQENIEGLTGLTITARSSGAQLGTLLDLSKRLAVLDPSQGAGGARIALSEALSGDPTSLARRYEIPRAALAKLRDTSVPVAERLKIIDDYLSQVGITSEAVAGKVDQDALAFRGLEAAAGDAKIAVGEYIATSGAPLARSATGALQGISQLITAYDQLAQSNRGVTDVVTTIVNPIQKYNELVLTGAANAIAWAGSLVGVQQAATDATPAIAAAGDEAGRAGANAAVGATGFDEFKNAIIRAHNAGQLFAGGTGGIVQRSLQDLQRVSVAASAAGGGATAPAGRALADTTVRGGVGGAAGAIAGGATIVQHVLDQERQRARLATAHTSELNKQLNLEEKIRDSKEAQYRAALDAAELTIKDRQQRRQEDQEIQQAQRILASGRASASFRAAAADKLALIDVERQKRALEISEKSKTAGGTIIGGRVFQSVPGGGGVAAPVPTLAPTVPGAPALGPSPAGGGTGIDVLVYLDGAQIAANVVTRLHQGLQRNTGAGGGTR